MFSMETRAEEGGRIRGGFEDGVDFEPSTSASSSLNNNNGNHHVEETGEEDEDVCRICRISGDEENPLYYPCACSGSIKFVHQDCLLQWLNHSNAKQCEVCKHAFSFSPVYAENAPARLPFIEVLLGTAMKALRGLHFFFRLSFVLSVWLLLIPFITFWIWRLSFVRSLMEARKLFLSRISRNHISPALLLTDCLHGFLLSAGIVFIFLGATSMREYFRHLREIERQNPDREDEVVNRQNVERAGRRLLIRDVPHVAGGNGEGGRDGHENVGGGQAIRRNGQNAGADHLEMQARFEAAHVEQIFDGGDDADGVEDVPFDELVGMQGPVFHLVENAITVLASNMIFLGIVIFLPFHLGRIVLSIASQLAITTSGAILTSGLSGAAELSLGLVNSTLIMNGPNSASNISAATLANDGLAGNTSATMLQGEGTSSIITNGGSVDLLTEALLATLRLSDVATLSIGYISILFLVFAYLGIMAFIRYSRGEPLTVGRIYGIASVAEAAPSLARQFLAGVKYFFTMVKVAFLLMVEIGIFPLLCGWWLDVCTISMLGTTLSQRVAFFWVSPVASSLFHWLVGIVYMLQISIFVSLLREVLRPGVLYFLRDPADPNYNPFRDLIDDPIHKHARRVLLSVVVYGSLIVLLVFLPVKLAMHLAPLMFPLDTSVSDPFTEIPADMLLFSICIPFAIEHFRPRATFKTVLFHWFSAVGWLLGLSDFLLPNPDDRDAQANAIADQGGQERQDIHQHVIQERNRYRLALPAGGSVGRTLHQNDGVASEENDGDDEEDSEEYKFAVRIVLLLFGAWLTLLCLSSAMVVIPISLGRAMFAAIPRLPITHGIKCNDLYSFNIGCYTLWAVAAGVGYAVDYLRMHNFKVLLMNLIKWSIIVVKCCVLLSLWIIVIPVFIGLLFELLLVVPLRVPVDESPVFLLYQDWALGLIFLKIWTKLVLLGQMAPLTDESWRLKFEQVKADGFSRLRGLWVLREIVAPILIKLLTALTLPYVFARGLFPLLGYSLIVNSAVYRFAWVGCLVLGLLWYWMRRFQQWFMDLHNSIRDDRYLIGRRLHNFKKEPQSNTLQRNNNSSAQAVGDLSMEDPIGADGEDKIVPESIEQNQSFSSGSSSGPMEMGNLRHRKASTSNH